MQKSYKRKEDEYGKVFHFYFYTKKKGLIYTEKFNLKRLLSLVKILAKDDNSLSIISNYLNARENENIVTQQARAGKLEFMEFVPINIFQVFFLIYMSTQGNIKSLNVHRDFFFPVFMFLVLDTCGSDSKVSIGLHSKRNLHCSGG